MLNQTSFHASDLARWALLRSALCEATRDQLMKAVDMPPPSVLDNLRKNWLQQNAYRSYEEAARGIECCSLDQSGIDALVARQWRWQQWCEQHGSGNVARYFLERKSALDQVSFWRLQTTDACLVAELYQQLHEGECSFEQLAAQAISGQCSWQVAYSEPTPLGDLPIALSSLLRAGRPGQLWLPRIASDGGWQLLQLHQRKPAIFDAAMRLRLLNEIGEATLQHHLESELKKNLDSKI